MTFYSTIILDRLLDATDANSGHERLHFTVEADSAHHAVAALAAYCKGRFEGSGSGGDIESLSKNRTRGVTYRGL